MLLEGKPGADPDADGSDVINIVHIFRDYGFSISKTEFGCRVTAKSGLEWGPISHEYRMKRPF